jgi:hypothetical protein
MMFLRAAARVVLHPAFMSRLCRFVPCALTALTALALAACAESRAADPVDAGAPGPDATVADAAVPDAAVPDAAMPDATVPDAAMPDAGSLDAGLFCPAFPASGVCLESGLLPARRPFELDLQLDACGCCPGSECAVDVAPASRTLRVTTTLCADPCDCAACNAAFARCAFPALEPGTWTLEVNGEPASRVEVDDGASLVPAPPACIDFAAVTSCESATPLDGTPQRVTDVCAASDFAMRHTLRLVDACGGCTLEGPCVVTVEPRLTDDLPPGNEIRVRASRYENACMPGCFAVCMNTTRTCLLPPLVEGETQRVYVEGLPPFTFVSGANVSSCASD